MSLAPTLGSLAGFARGGHDPLQMRRRRQAIAWAKWLLPVGALALLGSIALWPELTRDVERERVTLHDLQNTHTAGQQMAGPHYRGTDKRGEPYTITASNALQLANNRVDMTSPKADSVQSGGGWLMVQAAHGVYMQHEGQLDLSGDALLYRADGTTMISDTATMDTKAGAVASNDRTHAEGPFGTLDAQGFALVDKGDVIQFTGPARLVLNGGTGAMPAIPAPPADMALPNNPPRPPLLSPR